MNLPKGRNTMSARSEMQLRGSEVPTELAHRAGDGIDVLLLWDRENDRLRVVVEDGRTGESFELAAGSGREALELFHHPFAYAAVRGIIPASQAQYRGEPEPAEPAAHLSTER
jgi:hypothetical protein